MEALKYPGPCFDLHFDRFDGSSRPKNPSKTCAPKKPPQLVESSPPLACRLQGWHRVSVPTWHSKIEGSFKLAIEQAKLNTASRWESGFEWMAVISSSMNVCHSTFLLSDWQKAVGYMYTCRTYLHLSFCSGFSCLGNILRLDALLSAVSNKSASVRRNRSCSTTACALPHIHMLRRD